MAADEFPKPERRRHVRRALNGYAAIVMGPETLVFSALRDISDGGVRIAQPNRFSVRAGEEFLIAAIYRDQERAVRIVHVSAAGLHCAFVQSSA